MEEEALPAKGHPNVWAPCGGGGGGAEGTVWERGTRRGGGGGGGGGVSGGGADGPGTESEPRGLKPNIWIRLQADLKTLN